MLYCPILCFYPDVDCFSCEQERVCRTLNAFQTRACLLFTVIALDLFHLSKFYLEEKTSLLKQCFSYFNCRLLGTIWAYTYIFSRLLASRGPRKIFNSKRGPHPKRL